MSVSARQHGVACVRLRVSFRAFSRDLVPTEASGCAMSPVSAGFGVTGWGSPFLVLALLGLEQGQREWAHPPGQGSSAPTSRMSRGLPGWVGQMGGGGPFRTLCPLCVPWGTCLLC